MIDLSVVIAVKNEENNIPELIARIWNVIQQLKISYEIIFVTDHNTDNTYNVLQDFHKKDKNIKILKLSNRVGQYIAVLAGIHASRGNAVVTMDGDLQDYPEDIIKLYEKYREGYDVVFGIKEKKDESYIRNYLSKLFTKILSLLSDYKVQHNTNIFRIMSRKIVNEISRFQEQDPSLTGITNLIGFPSEKVLVTSGKRKSGRTNYNFIKLINLAINMILSFSTKPIRIISFVGLLVAFLGFLYLIRILIGLWVFEQVDVKGWPTLVSLVIFIGGTQLLAIGIIGEYIARIFIETKKRPLYILEEKIGDID